MDVAALASRLRVLAADLPAPGLATADAHLDRALTALTEAARESGAEVGLHRLGAAREHLAAARTRLAEAACAVDDYLDAIGAAGTVNRRASAPSGPATAKAAPVDARQWWTDRVDELCRRSGTPEPAATTPTKLFNELLKAAADGSADAYHRRLRDAGPETGVRLPGLAWPLVRALAAEHLGRAPAARDLPVLGGRCADRVRALVPGAEPQHLDRALASACALGPARGEETGDAAAAAALGPALVAALHRLPRRSPGDHRPERKRPR
ncbi:hypothetical protein [Glycomyces arizonensis]|uniref:hypothetical protein n=1 Tax=Glycomyces arizonensis TaxID=256035 RepID=UPI0004210A7C|nr:hypothetical protein [Glycomyces arizonensis]